MPVDDFAEVANITLNSVVVLLLSALAYKALMKVPLTYLDRELARHVSEVKVYLNHRQNLSQLPCL